MRFPIQHTLYSFPFSCGLVVHIELLRHSLPFRIGWVQRGPARRIAGAAYAEVNPHRKVPALVLPDGEVLTEIINILFYLDEQYTPQRDAKERRRLLEWLSFVATELHQQVLGPGFDPATPEEARADVRERLLPPVLACAEAALKDTRYLLNDAAPSSADAYLFWGLVLIRSRWPEMIETPALIRFRRQMMSHVFVRTALKSEQMVRQQAEAH